jgi:plastocyanin
MQSNRAALLLLGFVAIAAALAACGGDDETVEPLPTVAVVQDTATAPPTREIQAQPDSAQPLDATASVAEDGVIAIGALNTLFAPNSWTIAVGESITIQLNNADSQQHNLRIAGPDGEYQTQDDAVTVPEAVNGGESGELTFAPLVQGPYTFRCDFHPDTMGGQIEVQLGVP